MALKNYLIFGKIKSKRFDKNQIYYTPYNNTNNIIKKYQYLKDQEG